jgi:hypothetical protein
VKLWRSVNRHRNWAGKASWALGLESTFSCISEGWSHQQQHKWRLLCGSSVLPLQRVSPRFVVQRPILLLCQRLLHRLLMMCKGYCCCAKDAASAVQRMLPLLLSRGCFCCVCKGCYCCCCANDAACCRVKDAFPVCKGCCCCAKAISVVQRMPPLLC